MSSEIIRELFRSLETTMRQRMDVIEEIVRNSSVKASPPVPFVTAPSNEANFQRMNERINSLSELFIQSFNEMTREMSRLGIEVSRINETKVSPVAAADSDTDETPMEAVEAEVEAEVAEAEALETPDESVEEEEDEEVEELELEEFTFKGKTYYRDGDNNVYQTDDEGGIMDEPIGRWDSGKNRILRA